jgi:predicted permease
MSSLFHDLRIAARILIKNRGFAVMSILALALGIGATTSIFSVVNGVLLQKLPYKESERLVLIWEKATPLQLPIMWVSYPNFLDWRERNRVFEELAVFGFDESGLTGAGEPDQIPIGWSSSNLFSVLGTRPELGRGFTLEEDREGGPAVVVIGHGLWQRRFGGDPGVIGRTLRLDGDPYTIVGVMPRGFSFPEFTEEAAQAWVAIGSVIATDADLKERDNHPGLTAVGRLRPGVTPERATREMESIARALRQEHPENIDDGVTLVTLKDQLVGEARRPLMILLGAVALLLLIGCANVAGLLMAKASARQRELSVRAALGASRGRILRQLLSESVLLSFLAGVLGLLVVGLALDALLALSPQSLPRFAEVELDPRVAVFAIVVSLVAGGLAGLAPALQATGARLAESLKEAGARTTAGRGTRLRKLLVVAELALAVVLLAGAGLMVRSFQRILDVDPGFDPQGVLMMELTAATAEYPEPKQQAAFFQTVLERVRSLPGVTAAAVDTDPPLSGEGRQSGFRIKGQLEPPPGKLPPLADIQVVSPEYFETMGIPLVVGRDFDGSDRPGSRLVAVVDEAIARRFWPRSSPVGKLIAVDADESGRPIWREVIGVAGAVKAYGLEADSRILVYASFPQEHESTVYLAVRGHTSAAGLVPAIRREIWRIDRNQPIGDVRILEDLLATSLGPRRFHVLLLGIFAATALGLAALGVYGVLAQSVVQRTREIGVRMAVGASQRDVLHLVFQQGLALVLGGLASGLLAALLATRLLSSLLYEISATDPITFGLVSLLLALVAFVAMYLPARRATRIDPMAALRHE